MKKLKMMLILALLAVMVGSVWANAGRETTPASGTTTGPVTLRFSWWGTAPRHEATLAVIDAFHARYPNIRIIPEYGNLDGYVDNKTIEFASRTEPDIFQVETGSGPEYQQLGVLYNLSTLSDIIDFSRFERGFLESTGQYGTGQQWTLPTSVGGTAVTVNKTLQDRIGGIDFSQPYNWEQLITWGQRVRQVDNTAYLLSVSRDFGVAFFVRARVRQMTGASGINDATRTLAVTEAQLTEIYNYIGRLYSTGTAVPLSHIGAFGTQGQNDPNWIAGRYVAHIGFISTVDVVSAANPNVQYIAGHLPLDPNRRSDGWFTDTNQKMGISARTPHPREAATFLNFFYSDEAARLLGSVRGGSLPTINGARINAEMGAISALNSQASLINTRYNGRTDAGLFTSSEVGTILETAYEEVAYGRMTGAQAAAQVVRQINDFLTRR